MDYHSSSCGVFEDLCEYCIAHIFQFLTIPEQILYGQSVCKRFKEVCTSCGPVSCMDKPLQNVSGVPINGFFQWRPQGDEYEGLTLALGKTQYILGHAWADARIPVEATVGHLASSIFFRFKMQALRPNGGYCSFLLSRDHGEPGGLEVKFDRNLLRGYGAIVTSEDFGIRAESIKAGKWLHLHVQFDWKSATVKFSVDGVEIKVMKLNAGGWNGIHTVLFRGYIHSLSEKYLQAWSHAYVERMMR